MSNTSEQTLYGISLSQLQKGATQVNGGVYYDLNGFCFYVPDEVDANTSAFIYYPGSGGSGNDAKYIRELINNGSPEQIIVIADEYPGDGKAGSTYLQLISNIGSENSVDITSVNSMCFSASGTSGFNTICNIAGTIPDEKHSAIMCDIANLSLTDENINKLIDNESTLLFLEKQGELMAQTNTLAKAGVDVIVARTTGSHSTHIALNAEAIQNGIIAFASGDETELANADIYTFEQYNPVTGKWEQISFEEVADRFVKESVASNPYRYYDRLSKMDTELKCNSSFLGGKINTIRTAIKNSNFLSTTSIDQYSSTTQIPNAESEIVQKYFSSCAKMLNSLEKDTSKIIDIGNSIIDINGELTAAASKLNNSVNYYSNVNSNSNSNSWTSAGDNNYSGNYSGNYYGGSNSGSSGQSSGETGTVGTGVAAVGVSEFLKYNLLYSDTEKGILVYKNEKEKCKVVIHYENDKILKIDHYYQYPTRQMATDSVSALKEKYGTTCDDVLRETNILKVVMDEATYKDYTLTELKAEYEKMEEMVELKKEGEK